MSPRKLKPESCCIFDSDWSGGVDCFSLTTHYCQPHVILKDLPADPLGPFSPGGPTGPGCPGSPAKVDYKIFTMKYTIPSDLHFSI